MSDRYDDEYNEYEEYSEYDEIYRPDGMPGPMTPHGPMGPSHGHPPMGPPHGHPPMGPPHGQPPMGPPHGHPPMGPPHGQPPGPLGPYKPGPHYFGQYAPNIRPPFYIPRRPTYFPGPISPCRSRFAYIWLRYGDSFWAWISDVSFRMVYGYRWTGNYWVYFEANVNDIVTFVCI